ncbi:P-II family nitrogen regulator [Anaerocolumna sp. MB42-C2]|uniref:P-II family nitrogen regulator n=1 Tax=Anaerocolumna sp. MB42-C2 TaxID=3070997 RepID=UPI0027E139A1|nr:P-II family nitrogen regulator [Anaerocolumna sp. MB42-C2]WMJ88250.1 P-II family nitrogen regulator [Anaerocolumna sp. MB42-C2]
MEIKTEAWDFELISVIANFGMGSKILRSAKKYGICGGTITLARGTANNRVWDYLGLSDERKEILYMVANKDAADQVLDKINTEYKLNKPNHGIAFTTSISATMGIRMCKCDNVKLERGEENTMYQVITIIVEKGKAEDVIEAAVKSGSKGGTIVNGRGSGIHETSKLFSMDIEPEKEIVIILAEVAATEAIVTGIREDLKIDEPGKGIIYVQDVNKAYGIYK